MRKFLVGFIVFVSMTFLVTGCTYNIENKVRDNLSEIDYNIFDGQNVDAWVTFSSGMREDPFENNGKSFPKKMFGVFTVVPKGKHTEQTIKFSAKIGSEMFEGELEKNPYDGTYMADIGKQVKDNVDITLYLLEKEIILGNISKDFAVSINEAIKIAVSALQGKIQVYASSSNFLAECYFKIIDNKKNGFDDYFYYFSVIGVDKKSYSCVVSTKTGEVLCIH